MTTTIAGIVDKPADAQRILEELERECQCDRSDISLMMREQAAANDTAAAVNDALDKTASGVVSLLDAAMKGVEVLSHSLRGGGVVRMFGSFAVTLAKAGVTGGAELAKALVQAGVPQREASYYASALDEGRVLVTVQARTEKIAQCVRTVMARHGAVAPQGMAA